MQQAVIWESKFSKVMTSLWESSSGEGGEFVVDMPQKDAEGYHKRCGGGHSDDPGHLGAVTSRKTTPEDSDDVTEDKEQQTVMTSKKPQ